MTDEIARRCSARRADREGSVRTDDQDVVELLHPVDLGQQLVDHGVVHARAAGHAAALLADRVDLVEYDDVKTAVGTELFTRDRRRGRLMCELRIVLSAVILNHLLPRAGRSSSCSSDM